MTGKPDHGGAPAEQDWRGAGKAAAGRRNKRAGRAPTKDYDYLRVFPLRDTYVTELRLQVAY